MNKDTLKGIGGAAIPMLLILTLIWLLQPISGRVIPAAFQGSWFQQGAECGDADAKLLITSSTIDYDRLSFKAESALFDRASSIAVDGVNYDGGYSKREPVMLVLSDHKYRLALSTRDPGVHGSFVRCATPRH